MLEVAISVIVSLALSWYMKKPVECKPVETVKQEVNVNEA